MLRCWTSLRTVVHLYQMYRYVQIFRRLGTMQREVEGKTMNALSTELDIWACDTLCSSSFVPKSKKGALPRPLRKAPRRLYRIPKQSGTLEVWVPISMRLTYSIDRGFAGRQFNRPLRICISGVDSGILRAAHIRIICAPAKCRKGSERFHWSFIGVNEYGRVLVVMVSSASAIEEGVPTQRRAC